MRVNAVGLAVHDVNASAVGVASAYACGIMLVRIGEAAIVFFLELVLRCIRCGIAPLPEVFNETVALRVVAQLLERRELFIGDDPAHILIQPLLVDFAHLLDLGSLAGRALAIERIVLGLALLGPTG